DEQGSCYGHHNCTLDCGSHTEFPGCNGRYTPKLGPNREHALIFTPDSYKSQEKLRPRKRSLPTCNSKKAAREIQLCIQVAAFNFAFLLLFSFYLTECILILLKMKLPGIMQLIHPIMSGFLSFVIPWTLLFCNREITSMIRNRSENSLGPSSMASKQAWAK
ncbi:hypothetical protein OSTOST_04744, partial [Ostertagia ostertagi]